MAARLVQTEKALSPMLVTLLEITTLVKLGQTLNAELPMLVRLFEITSPVSFVHPWKAEFPMLFSVSGNATWVSAQPENAASPMRVTLLPMIMFVKLMQPENASSPMLVTPLG